MKGCENLTKFITILGEGGYSEPRELFETIINCF